MFLTSFLLGVAVVAIAALFRLTSAKKSVNGVRELRRNTNRPFSSSFLKKKASPQAAIVAMAIVKWGQGVVAKSGKEGGTVWQSNGRVRVWRKPANPRKPAQISQRAILASLSSAFGALTSAEIAAWNSFAQSAEGITLSKNVFGDEKRHSGHSLFVKINYYQVLLGLATFTNPPTAAASDSITSATAAAAAGANTFTIGITTFGGAIVLPANTYCIVKATTMRSRGRTSFGKSAFRVLNTYPPGTSINGLNIDAAYTGAHGALVAGTNIGTNVQFITTTGTTFFRSGNVGSVCTVAP